MIFKGTFKECISHLANRIRASGDKGMEAKESLVTFTGASASTVSEWLSGKYIPRGILSIKLEVFLLENEYLVKEVNDLPESIKKLGYILAYGLISIKEATKELSLPNESAIYRPFRGETKGFSQEREDIIGTINEICGPELEAKKQDLG